MRAYRRASETARLIPACPSDSNTRLIRMTSKRLGGRSARSAVPSPTGSSGADGCCTPPADPASSGVMPKRSGRAGALTGGTGAVRQAGGPGTATGGTDGGETPTPATRLSAPSSPARSTAFSGGCQLRDLALHVAGLDDVLVHPELLGLEAERQPHELREVQHRHPEVALHELGGVRLLEVEIEVAQRARRDHAVRVRVDRVGDVAAGLPQRSRAVHRDQREAAALVLAGVVHRR